MAPLYKSYVFKTKDPVIDELRGLVQQTYGSVDRKALKQMHLASNVSVGAMHEWFHGKTRQPKNSSTEAAGRALGFKRKWIRMNGAK